jgi:hypothetical protein
MKLLGITARGINYNRTNHRKRGYENMPNWSQKDIHEHMHVYSSDDQDIGHIAKVYEDSFLVHKGYFFPTDRYIPYSAITTVANDRVNLSMDAEEAKLKEWEKRPDYEDHLGDPLQLLYDRGHGVQDPFDEQNPDQT